MNTCVVSVSMNLAVIGLQFGDEGKGKIVDFLAERFDIIARFSGGSNAGHTVIHDGVPVKFHLLPSGVIRRKVGILGNGMAIDLGKVLDEIAMIEKIGIRPKLYISSKAHVVTSLHRALDSRDDELVGIGTTKQGIGPAYTSKYRRIGIRVADLYNPAILEKKLQLFVKLNSLNVDKNELDEELKNLVHHSTLIKDYVVDTEVFINQMIDSGKSVLFEGSQGTFLDVDFGTYPFVTSSSTTIGGVVTGLGVPPSKIHRVLGIAKAYTTRVGAGPFPTELSGKEGDELRTRGREYGATTGRPRRVGYLDMVLLRYASLINGVTDIALTKLDILQGMNEVPVGMAYECNAARYLYPPSSIEKCKVAYEYYAGWAGIEDDHLKEYIKNIERETSARVSLLSYGPESESTVEL